ncbi:MAG: multicopper oxidase family protein [Leptothrix sp. (in: b-proteobacteria)]
MSNRRRFIQTLSALGAGAVAPLTQAQVLTKTVGGLLGSVGGVVGGVAGTVQTLVAAVVSLPTNNGKVATPVKQPAPGTPMPAVKRLAGASHPKLVSALPNPLDPLNRMTGAPTAVAGLTAYTLAIREFSSQIGLFDATGAALSTTLWGYADGTSATSTPTSPGRTFDVQSGVPIQVTYRNELLSGSTPIAHRLGIDTTLMWANPGNLGGAAPVPLVAHRHGGLQDTASDGQADAWATPDANKDGLPDFRGRLYSTPYRFDNTQEAGHLWYHDHALGVTRLNVQMGLAGHYFIRDANEQYLVSRNMLPAPAYELPLLIQDRMYTATGQIFYPTSDPANPNAPAVTHIPEFFGDFILVNGVPWPKRDVEPRPYRMRLLNGSDSRFYDLQFVAANGAVLPFSQVGTELGLLDAPVALTRLLLAPGERYDLVLDFKAAKGQTVMLTNSAATPFPAGAPVDPLTAAKVMGFNVTLPLNTAVAPSVLPAFLRPLLGTLPVPTTAGLPVRKLMLLEGTDPFGRLQTMLGTVNPAVGNPVSPAHGTFFYSDPTTENVRLGSTEVWEIHNTTVDAHPIHLHLVDFRVINRQAFSGTVVPKPMGANGSYTGGYLTGVTLGAARPAEPHEAGRKDTVVAYPGEVTRIRVSFPRAGEYIWHCHILSHEDHEMMRRFVVA